MKNPVKKKTIVFLLSVVMLISIFPAYASTRAVCSLEIESVEAKSGKRIMLPVRINGNPGFSSFDMEVTIPDGWSPSAAVTSDGEQGLLANRGTLMFNSNKELLGNPKDYNGLLGYMNDYNITDDGVLFWLNLEVPENAGAGEYKISVKVKELTSDADNGSKNFGKDFSEATAVVNVPAALEIGDGIVNAGGSVMLPVKISGNPGFSSFQMKVEIPEGWSYAEAVPEVTGVALQAPGEGRGILEGKGLFAFNPNGGELSFAASRDNIEGNGTLFWLFLKVPDTANLDTYPVSIEVTELTSDAAHGSKDFKDLFEKVEGEVTVTEGLYTITVNASENGRLEVSPNGNVAKGTTVKINAIPEEGYVLKSLTVTDENGNPVDVTKVGDKFIISSQLP